MSGFMTGTVVNGLGWFTHGEAAAAVNVVGSVLGTELDVLGIGVSIEVHGGWELSEVDGTAAGSDVAVLVVWLPVKPDNKASTSCSGHSLQTGIFWLKISSLITSASTWALHTMQLARKREDLKNSM